MGEPFYSNRNVTLWGGDCREVMAGMEPESVHCVVTSPPYWGLRDYGTATWVGGDEGCDHKGEPLASSSSSLAGYTSENVQMRTQRMPMGATCRKCGAIRQDAQLGLEPTPEAYVANMVAVFREVRRVLRDDGTLWLNLGDSYANDTKWGGSTGGKHVTALHGDTGAGRGKRDTGLKPKDLVGIPWLVARALQAPYYSGRIPRERDRVWLAAMVDAEGTICGFDHDRADGDGHRSGVHLAITNTSTALLDEAARIWPASRSEHQRPYAGHLGTMQSWRWLVHGIGNKQAALRDLYPHLIAKRQQAVVAYTLLDSMANAKRLGHSPQKNDVLAKRRILTGLLSDLNHQRPVTLPDWLIEPPTLFEPGWYLRSDIIWAKPNPMPESVTDRPTKSHEYLFLLAKSPRYYFDADAVREPDSATGGNGTFVGRQGGARQTAVSGGRGTAEQYQRGSGRNIRSVWTIATQPYPGAHFAVFPPNLIRPAIRAGTPDKCCSECGAPWLREDWRAGCGHDSESVPGIVLDPFGGSGTVGLVAQQERRRAVLIDLNPDYLQQQLERTVAEWGVGGKRLTDDGTAEVPEGSLWGG